MDNAGNMGAVKEANHAPRWKQYQNYRGDIGLNTFKVGWSREYICNVSSGYQLCRDQLKNVHGLVLVKTLFYDQDGDSLTYWTPSRYMGLGYDRAFHLDQSGRILSTTHTADDLGWNTWPGGIDINIITLCVEAKDEHEQRTTRCITLDFHDRDWPF